MNSFGPIKTAVQPAWKQDFSKHGNKQPTQRTNRARKDRPKKDHRTIDYTFLLSLHAALDIEQPPAPQSFCFHPIISCVMPTPCTSRSLRPTSSWTEKIFNDNDEKWCTTKSCVTQNHKMWKFQHDELRSLSCFSMPTSTRPQLRPTAGSLPFQGCPRGAENMYLLVQLCACWLANLLWLLE